MFGFGFTELLLLVIIVVVVSGATKLPHLGEGLGNSIERWRREQMQAQWLRGRWQREQPRRWTFSEWALVLVAMILVVAVIANAIAHSVRWPVGLLSRVFGFASAEERRGIELHDPEPWRIEATKDVRRFLRAVSLLGGDGAFIYFEDTVERHVRDYLGSVAVEPPVRVQMGTIWPRPDGHHLPLTGETMDALASFLERQPTALLCVHVIAYRAGAVFLQWYDAFDAPIYLSRAIAEATVAEFAAGLGSKYAIGW